MKWITRSNVKVDRVACPWLIRRFVDPEAEFLRGDTFRRDTISGGKAEPSRRTLHV